MGNNNLTIKQENFCNYYIECGNASEAYRMAYSCENMKMGSVNRKAFEMLENVKITARIADLQNEMKEKSDVKKEEIVKLCTDVLRGKEIVDYKEESGNRCRIKTISKTWAVERLVKMLGFDSPTEVNIKKGGEEMPRDIILKELERIGGLHDEE